MYNVNKATATVHGKQIKAALFGIISHSFSDGSAVIASEDGLAYRVPREVVGDLYPIKRAQRVRFDYEGDVATNIQLA